MKYYFLSLFGLVLASNICIASPLQQMEQIAFAPKSETDSLLVYSKGKLIFEKYANGYTQNNKHIAWSVSKSISSAIVGALVYNKVLDINRTICDYVPAAREYNHCDLKTADFLNWSSGLIWNEMYEDANADREQSSVGQLLYGDGVSNAGKFVISHPNKNSDKKEWNYSTGDSNFLMAVAKSAVPENEIETFPWTYLFEPLEIDVTFGQDLSDTYGGGSAIYIKPRDLARIGELYLNRGMWNGKRIFAESWVDYTNSTPETFDVLNFANETFHSRRSWWTLNPKVAQAKKIPETLIANGHWGQYLVIIPALNTVIVRMGNNQELGSGFNLVDIIELAVRAVEQQQRGEK